MSEDSKMPIRATSRSKFDVYEDYYVIEGLTYKEIAEQFGLNQANLRKRGGEKQWSEKRKKYNANIKQKEAEKMRIVQNKEIIQDAEKALNYIQRLEQKDKKRLSDINFMYAVVNNSFRKMVVSVQQLEVVGKSNGALDPRAIELYVKCVEKLVLLERLIDKQPTVIEKKSIEIIPDPEAACLEAEILKRIKMENEIKRLNKKLKAVGIEDEKSEDNKNNIEEYENE